jgi:hypothetical protein
MSAKVPDAGDWGEPEDSFRMVFTGEKDRKTRELTRAGF